MLGIVAALQDEAACLSHAQTELQPLSRIGSDAQLLVSGMGPEAAREACEKLIAHGAKALLSWGTAGALSTELRSGTLLIPRCITDGKGDHTVNGSWQTRLVTQLRTAKLDVCEARLLSSAAPIVSPADKQRLADQSGAVAVDMESFSIAAYAATATVPFIAIRAIVDPADFALPRAAIVGTDAFGRPKWGALGLALMQQPKDIFPLVMLGRHFRQAVKTLGNVAQLIGPDFGWPRHSLP